MPVAPNIYMLSETHASHRFKQVGRGSAYGEDDSIGNQGFEGNRHVDRWQSMLEATVSGKKMAGR